jgi:chemotaxis protein histidine kinase CheA
MPDDLITRFLPRFKLVAQGRVAVAIALSKQSDHTGLMTAVRELHTLAGEAGLLGLGEIVSLARDSEHKARVFDGSRSDHDGELLAVSLRKLECAVEALGD